MIRSLKDCREYKNAKIENLLFFLKRKKNLLIIAIINGQKNK